MKTTVSIKKIILGTALMLFLSPTILKSQENKSLDLVFNSIKNNDYELLKPLLDDNVKINASIPIGMNDMVVPQVLEQIQRPESYTIVKTEKIGLNTRYSAEYVYKNKKIIRNFEFNSEGKIIDLDILGDALKVESKVSPLGFN